MKKLIALCIVSGVLISGVIGCSGSPTTKPPAPPPPADKEKPPSTADKDKAK